MSQNIGVIIKGICVLEVIKYLKRFCKNTHTRKIFFIKAHIIQKVKQNYFALNHIILSLSYINKKDLIARIL